MSFVPTRLSAVGLTERCLAASLYVYGNNGMRYGTPRLREAVQFTRHGHETLRQLFTGGLLIAIWWLGLPAAIVAGYLVRVLRITATGRAHLPVFDEWSDLMRIGARALGIGIIYAAIPTICLLAVAVRSVTWTSGTGLPTFEIAPFDAIVGLVSVFALLVTVPAAIVTYAHDRRVAAAFDPGRLWPLISARQYLLAVGLLGLLGAVTGVFTILATVLTYGSALLLSPLILFYVFVIMGYVLGTAYGETMGDLTAETRGPAEFDG